MSSSQAVSFQAILNMIPCNLIITNCKNAVLFINSTASELLRTLKLNEADLVKRLLVSGSEKNESFSLVINNKVLLVRHSDELLSDQKVRLYFLQDQTEYARSMNELLIFKTFLGTINDQGIMICDADHKILMSTVPASANVYDDMQTNYAVGKKYEEAFEKPELSNMLKALHTGKAILNAKNIYINPSGKRVVSFGSSYPIIENGKTIGAASVLRWNDSLIPLLNQILKFQNEFLHQGTMSNNTQFTFDNIFGNSPAIRAAVNKAKKAAGFSLMPILLYGETGTGKEIFAQSIHNASANKTFPFIAINCAAIPETLLEITLFGSVKGAFTDAQNTSGLFEQAGYGTIFLDEINSMPINLQAKILRVIQEKTFRKLGSSKENTVQCRIITSMNKPPLECIADNTLRQDLYYRISAIAIEIPPLRERREDIEVLANFFIQKYSTMYEIAPIQMPPAYLDMLKSHSWPGNVRELQHTIESSLVMLEPEKGFSVSISPNYQAVAEKIENTEPQTAAKSENLNLKEKLEEFEKKLILRSLNDNDWNISRTAKAIGVSRSNLQYRMERLNINKDNNNV